MVCAASGWPSSWKQHHELDMGTFIQCAPPRSEPTTKDDFFTLTHLSDKRTFKDQMAVNVNMLICALATKGILYPVCQMPKCTEHGLEHIGGPVHWKALWHWLGEQREKTPSYQDTRGQCWQTWCFTGGGLAFNHLDGAVEVWNGHYPDRYERDAHRELPNIVSHNTRALQRPPPPPPPPPPPHSENTRAQELLLDRSCRTLIEFDDFIKSVRDLALVELRAGRGVQMRLGRAPVMWEGPEIAPPRNSSRESASASSQSVYLHTELDIDAEVEGMWNGEWFPGKVYDMCPDGTITVKWQCENSSTKLPSCSVRPRAPVNSQSGVWY